MSVTPRQKRPPGRPRIDGQQTPTKELILRAATGLFLSNGYQDVSVDDVADKCDVTKATVYYYFGNKAALFTETMIQMMDRIRERMQAMLQEDVPLRVRLMNVADAQLRATVDIDMDGFMRETKNVLTAQQVQKMQQAEEELYTVLEEAFTEAVAAGEIGNIDPRFAAHAYISLVKIGNYRNAGSEGIFHSPEEAAEKIVAFFWNGLMNG
ncbi:TetR/AcrR family transcriptional regulator [Planococcus lenghuensis]|uniref:HTH tetR-type domain-containing protein n=1 Tax=Planococcus lenghuensis TaxID=2213202 RepID=A0A1Q2KWX8_9BACL|nr:TetR/AcrR family transcriptional regulator [Planococcus lenghuensis]AQQ52182.1 hypothetical protein B0X71_03015 [Planococcus lenghuensis]